MVTLIKVWELGTDMNMLKINKQLTQQQNLDELMKQTLLNILSAKGIIYTYYKNKKIKKVA